MLPQPVLPKVGHFRVLGKVRVFRIRHVNVRQVCDRHEGGKGLVLVVVMMQGGGVGVGGEGTRRLRGDAAAGDRLLGAALLQAAG